MWSPTHCGAPGLEKVESVMWSSDYGGAVSLRKSEARDAITSSSWGDGSGNKWRGVTRSSRYGCKAELGVGAAGWCVIKR
jgi:hypothetical protein